MLLKKWDKIPLEMKTEEVKKYYEILKKKKVALVFKRIFDIFASGILIIILSPLFLILAIAIKIDSKGPVFYRQVRVTQYNKTFRIFKFRTMIQGADKGAQVTVNEDPRITKVGRFIRKYRLDEISQLIDVFLGRMTFVGTRPESLKFVNCYTNEMMATLLLPAGITSLASIYYKDEAEILESANNADDVYVTIILPLKMHYNLKSIEHFSFLGDIKIMFMTVFAVLGKNYNDNQNNIKLKNNEKECDEEIA